MSQPILCLDFDGCIHRYSRGWQDGEIYDTVVEGFFDWALEAQQHFTLVVYSSRSSSDQGRAAMQVWLTKQCVEWWKTHPDEGPIRLEFAAAKPAAYLTIDDRAICFTGNWQDDALRPSELRLFKSWVQLPVQTRQDGREPLPATPLPATP